MTARDPATGRFRSTSPKSLGEPAVFPAAGSPGRKTPQFGSFALGFLVGWATTALAFAAALAVLR
jgi:hypothetical protein